MSAPTLTLQNANRAGLDLTTAAVAATGGGDSWVNSTGRELFYINNGGGSPVTLTLHVSVPVDGQTVASKTVAVPAGHAMIVGPFPTTLYNDSNGFMQATYSGVVSVTVAAFLPASS